MKKSVYLGYIAFFISRISPLTAPHEYRELLKSYIGRSLPKADESKIKKLARHLYRAYVAATYLPFDAGQLAIKLSDEEIEELLKSVIKLYKKFKIHATFVDPDISSTSHIDKRIMEAHELFPRQGKSSMTEFLEEILEKKKPKGKAAKKPRKKKDEGSSSDESSEEASTKKRRKKKESSDDESEGSTSSKKPAKSPKCSDYKDVRDLRILASSNGMKNYKTASKKDLCKFLGIK